MALKNKILQEFFNDTPKKFSIKKKLTDIPPPSFVEIPSDTKSHTYFRIFDNPIESKIKEENLEQINDVAKNNIGQSSDKLGTNLGQIPDKLGTNLGQIISRKKETSDKVRSEPRTKLRTKSEKSRDKTTNFISFSSLVGLQREIVLFIYEQCKLSRNRGTSSLSIEHLANSCKTTKLSAQKTVQRLEKKKIIIRCEYKNGRGGWTRYELPNSIYQEILLSETDNKLRTKLGQSSDKVRSEPRTQPRTIESSSSSKYINTTTTDTTALENKWNEVDISPLAEIGFTHAHLKQIAARTELTPGQVQESIEMFAFDLKENHKAKDFKKSPLDAFMGILGKGGIYTPPSNYETPQAREMRLYVERKKAIEERNKAQEAEAMNFAFKDWLSSVSPEQQALICKPTTTLKGARMAELRLYYEQNLWPEARKKILQGV